MIDAIGSTFILIGAAFGALAGIGQIRFEDLFTRMHVATKPATLGLFFVAVGAMMRLGTEGAIALLALSIILQFLTAPVAAHLIGRAAHRQGEWARDDVVQDDLAEVDEL